MRNAPALEPLVLRETDVAELLLVSVRTLQRWRQVGLGPQWARLAGPQSSIVYRREDIEAWLAEKVVTSA